MTGELARQFKQVFEAREVDDFGLPKEDEAPDLFDDDFDEDDEEELFDDLEDVDD